MMTKMNTTYFFDDTRLVLTKTVKYKVELFVILATNAKSGVTTSRTFTSKEVAITEFNKYFK